MRMRLEHYSSTKLRKEIVSIAGRHINLNSYAIFFFGSRVSGKGSERSDIDVGIQGPKPVPIQKLRSIKKEIGDIPTLYKIDVVDFHDASPSFRKVALQHVEFLTKKNYDKV